MRVFWALVIVCALAGGAFLFLTGQRQASAERAAALAAEAQARQEAARAVEAERAAAAAKPVEAPKPTPAPERAVETPKPAGTSVSPAPDAAAPAVDKPAAEVAKAEPAKPESPKLEAPKPDAKLPEAPITPVTPAAPTVDPATFVGPPVPPAEAGGNKIGVFEIAPGKVVKKDDGTLTLDDRFTVKGDGSAEKPYEITWELLTSVEQDFDPHAGKRKIPERIAMLHDKYVKLSGWIAFPLNVQSPRELLLMLNQWDGCCIGVPPTPYDAIEASLTKVVTGDPRFAVTGAVTGKFGVKPYIVGDWLVGLYTMENGDFAPKTFSGGGS